MTNCKYFTKHLNPYEASRIGFYDSTIHTYIAAWGVWMIPYKELINCMIHSDKIYLNSWNRGTYILPKDGSYIRYISNSWYE